MRVVVERPLVVEAMVKSGVFAAVVAELEIESCANGDVVPIPTLPSLAILNLSVGGNTPLL
jgi:hypothetical protein